MASEFSREFFSANRIVKADLHCARQPREQDLDKIKAELKSLYDATEVLLDVSVDESLLSGYVLQVGDRVFDNSGRHALDQMTGDKPDLATLKTRVEDYKPAANTAEGGTVVSAADGIVTVEGMDAPCTARSSPLKTVPRAWWKVLSLPTWALCCLMVPNPSAWAPW